MKKFEGKASGLTELISVLAGFLESPKVSEKEDAIKGLLSMPREISKNYQNILSTLTLYEQISYLTATEQKVTDWLKNVVSSIVVAMSEQEALFIQEFAQETLS